MKSWIVAGMLAVALCGAANADEVGAADVLIPTPEATEPEPEAVLPAAALPAPPYTASNGRAAINAWDDARGFRYGTDMIFALTRGMEDLGISGWGRWPMAVLTVPLDLAFLPTGLIAGLFGG
jgi:hypothetical protein